jgi:hypothetical protein
MNLAYLLHLHALEVPAWRGLLSCSDALFVLGGILLFASFRCDHIRQLPTPGKNCYIGREPAAGLGHSQ